ncbi:MAG TPA: hypothetical protein VMI10_06155 [Terriglobales bacterium]|nr:hypothetical protein [Terriglobales bacterium]
MHSVSVAAKKMLEDIAGNKIQGNLPGQPLADLLAAHSDIAHEVLTQATSAIRQEMLADFANMRDDGSSWFQKRWGRRIAVVSDDVLKLRDELRAIWKRPHVDEVDYILNKWLSWRPPVELWDPKEIGNYMPFMCSIEAAKLVPNLGGFHPELILGVFENWFNFKYCASPSCAAPYFIAKRKDQTVCNAEACKAEKQRQYALKWWRDNRAKSRKQEKNSQRGATDGAIKTR